VAPGRASFCTAATNRMAARSPSVRSLSKRAAS
jgi:hypothetical protein